MIKNIISILIVEKSIPTSYSLFLKKLFEGYEIEIFDLIKLKNSEDFLPDLILFTGGEDVHPAEYGEKQGKFTRCNVARDVEEKLIYQRFYKDVPKLGICRGAQFLTVMCGGSLIQHVENHNNVTHSIKLNDNRVIMIPSDHHQMIYPYTASKYEILGYSEYFLSPVYLNGDNKNIELPENFLESEIVFYPHYNSLAIQAHPEWCDYKSKSFLILKYLILQKLFPKLIKN